MSSKHSFFLTPSKPLDGKLYTTFNHSEEYQVPRFGLSHGLATQQKEIGIIAFIELVLDQVNLFPFCKEIHHHAKSAKNSLRAMAFNLIDMDNKQIFKYKKQLEIIKDLRKDEVVLKPD